VTLLPEQRRVPMLQWLITSAVALMAPAALAADPHAGAPEQGGSGRDMINAVLHGVATGIELTGVGIIVIGAASASLVFLHHGLVKVGWSRAFHHYRANLGRGILLGLELLVAADIIGTVAITPSLENLAVLGLIVLIRTFLSFSLQVEIEGHLPWRRGDAEALKTQRAGDSERL
jgi:uncharacterized membrane protein